MDRELWNWILAGALALAAVAPAHPAPKARAARSAQKIADKKPAPIKVAVAARRNRGFHAPDAYFVLQKEVSAALSARDLEKAEAACNAQKLLRPDRPLPYYNLATIHALRGHLDKGIDALTRAQERHFGFPDLLEADPDLAQLRQHPLWPQVLERARAIHQQVELAEHH